MTDCTALAQHIGATTWIALVVTAGIAFGLGRRRRAKVEKKIDVDTLIRREKTKRQRREALRQQQHIRSLR